jgi:hypothetical protein
MSLGSRRSRPLPDLVDPPPAVQPFLNDIFIRCPRTRARVATGLTIRWVMFDSLAKVGVPLRCPSCGQIHKWEPRDAWIGSREVNFRRLIPNQFRKRQNLSC